jgi:hypothetical protein
MWTSAACGECGRELKAKLAAELGSKWTHTPLQPRYNACWHHTSPYGSRWGANYDEMQALAERRYKGKRS